MASFRVRAEVARILMLKKILDTEKLTASCVVCLWSRGSDPHRLHDFPDFADDDAMQFFSLPIIIVVVRASVTSLSVCITT